MMPPGVTQYNILNTIPRASNWLLRPLTRRKGLLRLDELPEDILILILSHCRIDEIFALRLTCSTLRNVFSAYATHIIPSVAHSTFPRSRLLLRPEHETDTNAFAWLKDLIPKHLAAILVDRHRFVYEIYVGVRYGIPAEDALGDAFRARVANGWRVLRQLSNIAKDVYQMDPKEFLKSKPAATRDLLPSPRSKIELSRQREKMVLERQLSYVNSMPETLAQDYVIMFTLLSGAFRVKDWANSIPNDDPPWIFDFGHGIDARRTLRRGESWLTWFILNHGPQLFWEQWWSLPPEAAATKNHLRERALEAFCAKASVRSTDLYLSKKWRDVDEELHHIQRRAARQVHLRMHEKSGIDAKYEHVVVFRQYAHHRNTVLNGVDAAPPIEEVLNRVPFFVDFAPR